jgi:hypothetical protein
VFKTSPSYEGQPVNGICMASKTFFNFIYRVTLREREKQLFYDIYCIGMEYLCGVDVLAKFIGGIIKYMIGLDIVGLI